MGPPGPTNRKTDGQMDGNASQESKANVTVVSTNLFPAHAIAGADKAASHKETPPLRQRSWCRLVLPPAGRWFSTSRTRAESDPTAPEICNSVT